MIFNFVPDKNDIARRVNNVFSGLTLEGYRTDKPSRLLVNISYRKNISRSAIDSTNSYLKVKSSSRREFLLFNEK